MKVTRGVGLAHLWIIINLGLEHRQRQYNIATRLGLWPALFLIVRAQPITS